MRPYQRSRAQQMVFVRRRIAVVTAALLVLAIIGVLVLRKPGPKQHTVSSPPPRTAATTTTTTAPAQLRVAAASWQLATAVARAVVLPLGNHLGIFGGLGPGSVTSSAVTDVDPVTGQAVRLGNMPKPVHDAAGAAIGNTSVVFGGGSTTESASVQQFTLDGSGKLTSSTIGTLPTKRADLVAVAAGSQVIVLGGFDGSHWLPSVLATTDGVTFTTIAQLTTPVRYPAASLLGNTVYVFGGELTGSQADATVVQAIDLQTRTVSVAGQLPGGLSHASAATIGGVIYLFGGRSGGHAVDVVSTFDPRTGLLQTAGHLPAAASDMSVATLGQTVYLVGGESSAGHQVNSVVTARLGRGGGN